MKQTFFIILFIIGTTLVGMFYLRPQWERFQSFRDAIGAFEETSAAIDELIEKRDALLDTINSVSREKITQVEQAFPRGARAEELVVIFETLVDDNQMLLRSINISDTSAARRTSSSQPLSGSGQSAVLASSASIRELPLTLSIAGSYESLKNLLRDIERSLRIIDVTDISFSAGSGTNLLNFTIKAKAYYQ